jgi:hypothetical protein
VAVAVPLALKYLPVAPVLSKAFNMVAGILSPNPDLSDPINQKLKRENITSINNPGQKLSEIVGDNRSGVTGSISPQRLLEEMVRHETMAREHWDSEPFAPGQPMTLESCADAEVLYHKCIEVDYHLSNALAYATALQMIAERYVDYCQAFANSLEGIWPKVEGDVKTILNHSQEWHRGHCDLDVDCYRAKWVKAPPPPPRLMNAGAAPGARPRLGDIVRRPPPPARPILVPETQLRISGAMS